MSDVRDLCDRAVRRALPPGVAAVGIGAGASRILVVAPALSLPAVRHAPRRRLAAANELLLLLIVRLKELAAR